MPSKFAGHMTCSAALNDGCDCPWHKKGHDLLAACEGMREALRAIRVDSEEWEDRFDGKTAAMSAISDSARAALALADRVLGK